MELADRSSAADDANTSWVAHLGVNHNNPKLEPASAFLHYARRIRGEVASYSTGTSAPAGVRKRSPTLARLGQNDYDPSAEDEEEVVNKSSTTQTSRDGDAVSSSSMPAQANAETIDASQVNVLDIEEEEAMVDVKRLLAVLQVLQSQKEFERFISTQGLGYNNPDISLALPKNARKGDDEYDDVQLEDDEEPSEDEVDSVVTRERKDSSFAALHRRISYQNVERAASNTLQPEGKALLTHGSSRLLAIEGEAGGKPHRRVPSGASSLSPPDVVETDAPSVEDGENTPVARQVSISAHSSVVSKRDFLRLISQNEAVGRSPTNMFRLEMTSENPDPATNSGGGEGMTWDSFMPDEQARLELMRFDSVWRHFKLHRIKEENESMCDVAGAAQHGFMLLVQYIFRRLQAAEIRIYQQRDVIEARRLAAQEARAEVARDNGLHARASGLSLSLAMSGLADVHMTPNERIMKQAYDLLVHFRAVETEPILGAVSAGFFSVVDNFATILLYGDVEYRRRLREKARLQQTGTSELAMNRGQDNVVTTISKDDRKYLMDLENLCFKRAKSTRVIIFGCVLVFLIVASVFTISAAWRISGTLNLEAGMIQVHAETEAQAALFLYQGTRDAELAAQAAANPAVDSLSSSASDADLVPLEQELVGIIRDLGVDGIHYTTDDGFFLGVFRPSYSHSSFPTVTTGNVDNLFVVDQRGATVTVCPIDDTTYSRVTADCQTDALTLSSSITSTYWYYLGNSSADVHWSLAYPQLVLPTVLDASAAAVSYPPAQGNVDPLQVGITLITQLSASNGVPQAVLGVDIRSSRLSYALSTTPRYASGAIAVTDASWNVIASSSGQLVIDASSPTRIPDGTDWSVDALTSQELKIARSYLFANYPSPGNEVGTRKQAQFSADADNADSMFVTRDSVLYKDYLLLGTKRVVEPGLNLAVVVSTSEDEYSTSITDSTLATFILIGFSIVFALILSWGAWQSSRATSHMSANGDGSTRSLKPSKSHALLGITEDAATTIARRMSHHTRSMQDVGTSRDLPYDEAEIGQDPDDDLDEIDTNVDDDEGKAEEVEDQEPRLSHVREDGRLTSPISDVPRRIKSNKRDGTAVITNEDGTIEVTSRDDVVKNEVNEHKHQFSRSLKWTKFTQRGIYTVLGTMIICIGMVWLIWSASTRSQVAEVSDEIVDVAQTRVFNSVHEMLDDPVRLATYVGNRLARDAARAGSGVPFVPLNMSGQVSGARETYDRFIVRTMTGLSKTGRPVSELTSPDLTKELGSDLLVVVTAVYVGFPNGEFAIGDRSTGTLQVGGRDSFSSNCYTKYFVGDAEADTNRLEPSNEADQVRDVARVSYEDPGCVYSPLSRQWYTKAKAAREPIWTLATPDDSVTETVVDRTITYSVPVFNPASSNNLYAVVGVDLSVELLNSQLNRTLIESSPTSESFVMSPAGKLLASSNSTNAIMLGESAVEARSEQTQEAALFLSRREGGLDAIRGTESVKRALQEPLTSVARLESRNVLDTDGTLNGTLSTIVVLTLPFEGFQEDFDRRFTRAFLISVGTMLLVLIFGGSYFRKFRHYVFEKRAKDFGAHDEALESLGGKDIERKRLKKYLEAIRPVVLESCAHSWQATMAKQARRDPFAAVAPLRMDELQNHYRDTAISHIDHAREGRNILTMCSLTIVAEKAKLERYRTEQERRASESGSRPSSVPREAEEAPHRATLAIHAQDDPAMVTTEITSSQWPLRLYLLHTSIWYRVAINLVIVMHIFMYFGEPDTYEDMRDTGADSWILLVESIFILIEAADLILELVIKLVWETEDVFGEELGGNILKDVHSVRLDAANLAIQALVVINLMLMAAAKVSIEYVLPLRPLMLVLRNEPVRNAAGNFFKTLIHARDVFVLYFAVIIVASAMGLILFRRILADPTTPEASYSNFVRSLVTTFVYISTGENYTELIYSTEERSPFYMLFWVFFCLVGMFFVLAMVIGLFQHGYKTLREAKRREDRLARRVGMVAAYVLLDMDSSGELSRREMFGFLRTLRPNMSREVFDRIFTGLNQDDAAQQQIDIHEFVTGIENLGYHRLVKVKNYKDIDRRRIAMQLVCFERSWFRKLRLLLLTGHIWCTSIYGVYDNEKVLDIIMSVFLLIYFLELILRILAYGIKEFWYYSSYHVGTDAMYEMMANRFDFVIITFSVALFAVSRIAIGRIYFNDDEDSLRFVMTFPLFRLFAVIKRTRKLVFTLVNLIPQFTSILVVLLVVFFFYGVLGVWMLADEFRVVLQDDAPQGNFDSLGDALLTLFQLLVGEGWHEVMYAAIRTSRTFAISSYFISFIMIVSLLFTNVFIGIVLDSFQELLDSEKKAEAEEKKRARLERSRRDSKTRPSKLGRFASNE